MHKKILATCGLIGVGILGRLIPHIPNMTPLTAITLAGSKYVGRFSALFIPLGALILSDIVIGFYDWKILISVYTSFLFIGLLGGILKKFSGVLPIATLTLLSPFIFFFITNTAVWAFSPWYAKSIEGLLYCYSLGIPFLRTMLIGDIIFTATIYGVCETIKNPTTLRLPKLQNAFVKTFVTSVIFSVSVFFSFTSTAYADTNTALLYLRSQTQNSWVTMARIAGGDVPDISYLTSVTGTTAIELEAPLLAITAAGENPRTYGDSDLVARLEAYFTDGQIGDPTTINDDVFGVLALYSAGVAPNDTLIIDTKNFIVQNQNTDGGWSFQVGGTSDTNTTAAAIMALVRTGTPPTSDSIQQALLYLHGAQNNDGGFPYDPTSSWGTASDASSDAWVLMALSASGENLSSWTKDQSLRDNLLSFQVSADGAPTGYFEYQTGSGEDSFSSVTTSYAVLALSNTSLPVRVFTLTPTPTSPSTPQSGGGSGSYYDPYLATILAAREESYRPSTIATSTATTTLIINEPLADETSATSTSGTVLGASIYQFTKTIFYGSEGVDVEELQKILIASDLISIEHPTRWFGSLTQKAVERYQTMHAIPAFGIVGPLTRAYLNGEKL